MVLHNRLYSTKGEEEEGEQQQQQRGRVPFGPTRTRSRPRSLHNPFEGVYVYNPHDESFEEEEAAAAAAVESDTENENHTHQNNRNNHNINNDDDSECCESGDDEVCSHIESDEGSDQFVIDASSSWSHYHSHSNTYDCQATRAVLATTTTAVAMGDGASEAEVVVALAEEEEETSPDTSYRRHGWIGIGLIVAFTTIALAVIGVWQHQLSKKRTRESNSSNHQNKNDEALSLTFLPTPFPTPVPTDPAPFPWDSLGDYHESLLQTVLSRVESVNANNRNNNNNNNKNLLDAYSWTTRGTPQFEALRFVAYQDGGIAGGGDMGYFDGSSQDTPLLLQRLGLLVLYFQTGGGFSWDTVSVASVSTSTVAFTIGNNRRFLEEASDDVSTIDNIGIDISPEINITPEDWATPGVDECLWNGVSCDDSGDYRATQIRLNEYGLVGSLPAEVWLWLPHLTKIDLSNNRLTGTLPNDFFWPRPQEEEAQQSSSSQQAYLSQLNHLDLSFNSLEGSLPETLEGGLFSLQVLNLDHNRFTGSLPRTYDKNALEQLNLSSNKLTGTLPFDDWFLASTSNRNSNNNTSNSSTNYDTKNSLLLLDLGNNLLSGTIQESLGNHPFLEFLSLQNNPLLSGSSLPSWEVFSKLTSLQTLHLSDCGLEGSLTETLSGLLGSPHLERISMSGNKLTGSLPSLENVRQNNMPIAISSSSTTTYDDDSSSIGAPTVSVLEALNLGNNAITGTIPQDLFADWLTNLGHLQLFGNDLEGTIPHASFDTSTLSVLWIQNNPELTGTMPCVFHSSGATTSTTATATNIRTGVNPKDDEPGYILHDYRADCWLSTGVECPCCRRCF